jgi:hypothetical protein
MGKIGELIRQLFVNSMEGAAGAFGLDASYRIFILGVIAAAFAVFYSVIAGVISGFSFYVNDDLERAMSWFVPPETSACIAALIAARIARSVLDYHLLLIGVMGQVGSPTNALGRPTIPRLPSS